MHLRCNFSTFYFTTVIIHLRCNFSTFYFTTDIMHLRCNFSTFYFTTVIVHLWCNFSLFTFHFSLFTKKKHPPQYKTKEGVVHLKSNYINICLVNQVFLPTCNRKQLYAYFCWHCTFHIQI